MKLNTKAIVWSGVVSLFQAVLVTYITISPQPITYHELLSFKFVMAALVLWSGVGSFAHVSFRDPNTRTRETDSSLNLNVLDVINRRK